MKVFCLCGEGKPGIGKKLLGDWTRRLRLLVLHPEWKECHEVCYLLSHHHLHRPIDKMKFSKLLPLPEGFHRNRSKTRSDISPTEGQNEPDPATPRPTVESTPDLRIETSTSPTSSPSISRDQESNGMQTAFFFERAIPDNTFRATQTDRPFLIDSALYSR